MAQQLARPKDHVEVYWFSEQPYGHVTDADLEPYESGRLGFPNTHFDPEKAHVLYNQYHEQYALADEVGFDGIMSNEHHASYWCMKPVGESGRGGHRQGHQKGQDRHPGERHRHQ